MLLPCGSRQWEEQDKEEFGLFVAPAVAEQERPFCFVVHIHAKRGDRASRAKVCWGHGVTDILGTFSPQWL